MVEASRLPPTDHVARVLLSRGARDQAIALLHATVTRNPDERACAALLRAVEARPDASVYVPELAIDLPLVREYCRLGMLREAVAVLRGTELGEREGCEELRLLEELFAIVPGEDAIATQIERGDGAAALEALAGRSEPWAARAVAILRRVMLGEAVPAASKPNVLSELESEVGVLIDKRDLRAAAAAAQALANRCPGEMPFIVAAKALARLVEAIDDAERDMETAEKIRSTQPMAGYPLAALQLRMGNLERGEQLLRRVLEEEPNHPRARERLADLEALRTARAAATSPMSDDDATGTFTSVPRTLEEDDTVGERISDVPKPASERPPFMATLPERPSVRRKSDPNAKGLVDPLAETNNLRREELDPLASTNELPRAMLEGPTGLVDPLSATAEARNGQIDPLSATAHATEESLGAFDASATLKEPPREAVDTSSGLHRGLLSNPELLAKKIAAPSGAYAPNAKKASFDIEPRTEELRQDLEAELLLKQGYADRSLEIYERLAARHPAVRSYAIRAAEIRDLIRRDRVPVPAEVTVRRHIPEVAGHRDMAKTWDQRDHDAASEPKTVDRHSEPPTMTREASSAVRLRGDPPSNEGVRVSQIIVVGRR